MIKKIKHYIKKNNAKNRITELLGICSILGEKDWEYNMKAHILQEVHTLEYKYGLGCAKDLSSYSHSEYLKYLPNFQNVL